MTLVGYSDSEDSDLETSQPVPQLDAGKRFDRSGSKKIKVDLSGLTSKSDTVASEEPATKRQRTGGAFSSFNSLLPAPKKAAQPPVKKGISLKTSSEAAFSRERPSERDLLVPNQEDGSHQAASDGPSTGPKTANPAPEVKLVGKATRFVPLSVANARKKKPVLPPKAPATSQEVRAVSQEQRASAQQVTPVNEQPKQKPKKSLFAVDTHDTSAILASSGPYQPEFTQQLSSGPTLQLSDDVTEAPSKPEPDPMGAQKSISDLHLSESERRRLFGRNAKRDDIKITHFDMDAEYRANQEIAAKGDLVEHRAVKAIAPGKHSLQQLVNNVRGQTDALEDKWAEGRRNRNESGSKYGW